MRRCVSYFVLAVLLLAAASSHAQSPNAPRLFELGMDALLAVGPDRDDQSAIDHIRRSADLGYPPAEVVLGYFYETGTIVAAEPGMAAIWYKKAALQDDPVGEWLLGRLIYTGAVQRDLTEAGRWLQKAASHNDPFGEYLLGRVKLERQEYAFAAEWFRKAAMQGLPQAQQQLGQMLKQGQGVNVNKSEAYMWLLMSFNAGNQAVANRPAGVSSRLEYQPDRTGQIQSPGTRTRHQPGGSGSRLRRLGRRIQRYSSSAPAGHSALLQIRHST